VRLAKVREIIFIIIEKSLSASAREDSFIFSAGGHDE